MIISCSTTVWPGQPKPRSVEPPEVFGAPCLLARIDFAVAQEERSDFLALAGAILDRRLARAHQIAHRFVGLVRRPDLGQLASPEQACQLHGIAAVRLHPLAEQPLFNAASVGRTASAQDCRRRTYGLTAGRTAAALDGRTRQRHTAATDLIHLSTLVSKTNFPSLTCTDAASRCLLLRLSAKSRRISSATSPTSLGTRGSSPSSRSSAVVSGRRRSAAGDVRMRSRISFNPKSTASPANASIASFLRTDSEDRTVSSASISLAHAALSPCSRYAHARKK